MVIYECNKCNRIDGTNEAPCVLILPWSARVPELCPYAPHAYTREGDKAEWVKVAKMSEDVKL